MITENCTGKHSPQMLLFIATQRPGQALMDSWATLFEHRLRVLNLENYSGQ